MFDWLGYSGFTTGRQLTTSTNGTNITSAFIPSDEWLYLHITISAENYITSSLTLGGYDTYPLFPPYTPVHTYRPIDNETIALLMDPLYEPSVLEVMNVTSENAQVIFEEIKLVYTPKPSYLTLTEVYH